MSSPNSLQFLYKEIPVLQSDHVRIGKPSVLHKKLSEMIAGGRDKLQLVTDYDLTITRHHINGVVTESSFCLFTKCKSLPADYVPKNVSLKAKYYPIEMDPNLTKEEKRPHMNQWYAECEQHFNGIVLEEGDLESSVKAALPSLRDGTLEMIRDLEANNVPVLVLSAGLGDVIKVVLQNYGVNESENFRIVSNFFKLDEAGVIQGYGNHENGKFIHPYNKSGLGCVDYFNGKNVEGRSNVILMGDSLGDANMDEGIPSVENVLRIGFLYGSKDHVEKSLPNYTEQFDIVLIDDQTMIVPQAIFREILRK